MQRTGEFEKTGPEKPDPLFAEVAADEQIRDQGQN